MAAELIVRDKKFRGDCLRICKDRSFVPDLIQDVALKVLSMPEEKVDSLLAQDKLFFYAGRIAVNLNNDRYRKQLPLYEKPLEKKREMYEDYAGTNYRASYLNILQDEPTESLEPAYELLEEPVTQGNEKAWYEWAVFSLWVKLDYCALCVGKATNINKNEVRRVVAAMKERYRIRLYLQTKLSEV